jgi:hypothetical protein
MTTSPKISDQPLPEIMQHSLALLRAMYDEQKAIFSFSTSIENCAYSNDFEYHLHMRYTVNTLLGLQKLSEHHVIDWDVRGSVNAFLDRQLENVTNLGDQGLLLYLLARMGHSKLPELYARFIGDKKWRYNAAEPVQNLCWRLIGLSECARAGVDGAAGQAEAHFKLLHSKYFCRDSLFVKHNQQFLRGDFVSFGALVYWLKSLWHYSDATGDDYAQIIFKEGVEHLLSKQLPDGGWPWYYHAQSGRVMDAYEIYSVHQDAMAHLFLMPAEALGVAACATEAIKQSTLWLHGQNDLGEPSIVHEPFLIYRSIRRAEDKARAKRFARAVFNRFTFREECNIAPSKLEWNPECRSYHIGWMIYAWADRDDADAQLTGRDA